MERGTFQSFCSIHTCMLLLPGGGACGPSMSLVQSLKQKGNSYLANPLYFFLFQNLSFLQNTFVHSVFASNFLVWLFSASCPLNACLLEIYLVYINSRFIPEISFCISRDEGKELNGSSMGGGKEGKWGAVHHHIVHWKCFSEATVTSHHMDLSLLFVVVLFYIYTWTLGYENKELKEGLMKMNKMIFTFFKTSFYRLFLLTALSDLWAPTWDLPQQHHAEGRGHIAEKEIAVSSS